MSDSLGACHAIALPFAFRTFDSPTSDSVVGPDPPLALSDAMIEAWIRFIRTGSPAHAGASSWPSNDTEHRPTMVLDEVPMLRDDPDATTRRLYDGFFDRRFRGEAATE